MDPSCGGTYRAVAFVGASTVVLSSEADAGLDDAALLRLGLEQARRAGIRVRAEDLRIVDVPIRRSRADPAS